MSRDLTNLFIDETFQYLVQTSGSVFTDGTGSLLTEVDITASNAVSSSYALTASYALNSIPQVSASYATSASHAVNADTALTANTATTAAFASAAATASYALDSEKLDGKDGATYATTGSNTFTDIQTISNTGGTAQLIFGRVNVASGGVLSSDGFTGSLQGNADTSVSSSYALTASYALNSVPQVSASYAVSASQAENSNTSISSSHALNADNSISSSYSVSALSSSYSNTSTSASHALSADTSISSSYAVTASHALNAGEWNGIFTGSAEITGSFTLKGNSLTSFSSTNIAGFTKSISESILVPDDTRGYLESPLVIETGATVEVPATSTVKVLTEFGEPVYSASYASVATIALNAGEWDGIYTGSAIISGGLSVNGESTVYQDPLTLGTTAEMFTMSPVDDGLGNNYDIARIFRTNTDVPDKSRNNAYGTEFWNSSSQTYGNQFLVSPQRTSFRLITPQGGFVNMFMRNDQRSGKEGTGFLYQAAQSFNIEANGNFGNSLNFGYYNPQGTAQSGSQAATFSIGQTVTDPTRNSVTFNGNEIEIGTDNLFNVSGSIEIGSALNTEEVTISGKSVNVQGDLIVSESKNLNVNGYNQFRYGAFYDTTTQTGTADTAHTFTFNTTQTLHASSGVTIVGGSQITYDNEGVYDNILESQVSKTDSGTDTVSVWIQKNGIDVVASRKQVTLSGNNAKQVVSFNWVQHVEVGDYIEILWSSPDANIQFVAQGTATTPTRPSAPSLYLNVNQVG